jgi:hypothetical protein
MSYGFSHSYTCGRPDALSALLAAGLLFIYSLRGGLLEKICSFVLAAAIPFTQYGLAIYIFAVAVPLVFFYRAKTLRYFVWLLFSIATGFLLQYALYRHLGIWDIWVQMIRSEGSENIIERIIWKLTTNPLKNHINTIPKDYSAAVLYVGILVVFLLNLAARNLQNNLILAATLVLVAWVGIVMYVVGKFPTYYGWMLTMPLSIALAAYFERERSRTRNKSWVAACVAALAVALGLPMQSALASFDWSYRNPAQFGAWVDNHISESDIVYCEYPFYFPVKKIAKKTYVGRYWRLMDAAEKADLDVVVLGEKFSEFRDEDLIIRNATTTSEWKPSRGGILGNDYRFGILSAPNYECTLYRLK